MEENETEYYFEILLVEDNEGDAFLTKKAFEETGLPFRLTVVEDGDQAFSCLRKENDYKDAARPDLILLDMNLPKQNGLDILKEIKLDEDFKSIPVIVLSSSRAERDVLSSYDLHGNGYILKPQGMKKLHEVVSAIESFWFKTAILPPVKREATS